MTVPAQPFHITGFEYGLIDTGTNHMHLSSGGTVTIQGTTKRSGSYALRVQPATGVATYLGQNREGATSSSLFGRLYIRFATLPDGNMFLFHVVQAAGNSVDVGLAWNNATSKIRPAIYDEPAVTYYYGTDHSATITTGVWYRLDYQFVVSPSTTQTIDFQIDGVAGTQLAQASLSRV